MLKARCQSSVLTTLYSILELLFLMLCCCALRGELLENVHVGDMNDLLSRPKYFILAQNEEQL